MLLIGNALDISVCKGKAKGRETYLKRDRSCRFKSKRIDNISIDVVDNK